MTNHNTDQSRRRFRASAVEPVCSVCVTVETVLNEIKQKVSRRLQTVDVGEKRWWRRRCRGDGEDRIDCNID